DFDETLPGPWEWDVKRLAASLVIAARDNDLGAKHADRAAAAACRSYREHMGTFADMRHLDLFYYRIAADEVLDHASGAARPHFEQMLGKARTRTNDKAFAKMVEFVDGSHRLKVEPPLTTPLDDDRLDAAVRRLVEDYRPTLKPDRRLLLSRYSVVDVAHKVVGVGSVGRRCYVVFLLGSDQDDPLFLQVKEAQASVLEPYAGPPTQASNGERVVVGQRLTQAASDLFLGWCVGPSTHRTYYVRQLWDVKGQSDVLKMDAGNLSHYAALCGWALARAHARTGDPVQLAAYLGGGDAFDRAIVAFSAAYAATNAADHKALLDAIASGRVEAEFLG
ncbi:MAG: DUF2252 domain-containing protein, partial [Acidimicrobiales bacterium]|nr:DUF2252 domain-containing protein [Acidimicrobiales bacterium]